MLSRSSARYDVKTRDDCAPPNTAIPAACASRSAELPAVRRLGDSRCDERDRSKFEGES